MRSRARCRGFSLAELLTVLGIIGVLVTLSVPALRGVSEGTGMMQALTRIGGTLDLARNYAVANNTHTWVAFTENAQSGGESMVRVAAFASRTGASLSRDDETDAAGSIEIPSPEADIISPVETIRQARVGGNIPQDNALATGDTMPRVSDPTEFPLESRGLQFRVKDMVFNRSIHFMPSGEASLGVGITEAIEMVVAPEKVAGVSSEKDNRQAAVIRVSGLTGQALVYQPR